MSCNWFPTKVHCFHECLLTQFRLFALNISVCTKIEHQGTVTPQPGTVPRPQKPLRSSSMRQEPLRFHRVHDVTYAQGTIMPAMHVIYVVSIWYMPAMWLILRVLSLYHISTMKVIYAMVIMSRYLCHFSNSKLRLSQITYWDIFGCIYS